MKNNDEEKLLMDSRSTYLKLGDRKFVFRNIEVIIGRKPYMNLAHHLNDGLKKELVNGS